MPMTLLEIKTYIDNAIVSVTQEIADSAGVPAFEPFPYEAYSNQFEDRLQEELEVIETEDTISNWRFSRSYDKCNERGLIIIEFTYTDDAQMDQVRYEVVDWHYVVER